MELSALNLYNFRHTYQAPCKLLLHHSSSSQIRREVPCVVVFHLYYSLHSIVLVAAVSIQSNTWRVFTSMGSVCSEKKPLSGMHYNMPNNEQIVPVHEIHPTSFKVAGLPGGSAWNSLGITEPATSSQTLTSILFIANALQGFSYSRYNA